MKYTGTIKLTTNDKDNLLLKVREREAQIRPQFKLDNLDTIFILREVEIKTDIEAEIIINGNNVILEAGSKTFKGSIERLICLTGSATITINYSYGDSSSFDSDANNNECSHTCDSDSNNDSSGEVSVQDIHNIITLRAIPTVKKIVRPSDKIEEILQSGVKVVELVSGETYQWTGLSIPSGVTIKGNGAIVKPINSSSSCINILTGAYDISIEDVTFLGQSENVQKAAYVKTHFAINVLRAFNVTISKCNFRNWLGGGIGFIGGASDDYMHYGANVVDCRFHRCWFGIIRTGRYEYGRDANNYYGKCCVAIWDEAGNWSTTNAKAVWCRNPYISANKAVDYTIDGVNAYVANSAHGSINGLEGNHSADRSPGLWDLTQNIPLIGGSSYPVDRTGIILDGILPPTMTGITCYYCNITLKNRASMQSPSRISGIVSSNCSIVADVPNVLELFGHTSTNSTTLTNVSVATVTGETPIATTTTAGIVKVGSGLAVDEAGTISATVGGRSEINVSPREYIASYNSQLGTGNPEQQGWVMAGTNDAVTNPDAAQGSNSAAGFFVKEDDLGVQSTIAIDSSSTHNPTFGIALPIEKQRELYQNGGVMKLKWKPYKYINGGTGIIGISFTAKSGEAFWTGVTNQVNQWYIYPILSAVNAETKTGTISWHYNQTTGTGDDLLLTQTEVDLTKYMDVEIRMAPQENVVKVFLNNVQIGKDRPWGTATAVAGGNFSNKLFWASGSAGGFTIGMWIREMSATVYSDNGVMTTPGTDADTTFNLFNDFRDKTLVIKDQDYSLSSTIKGNIFLPIGTSLTIKRENNNVLLNGSGENVIIEGNGMKQTVELVQTIGPSGKTWVSV